jgi:hypothetical protein
LNAEPTDFQRASGESKKYWAAMCMELIRSIVLVMKTMAGVKKKISSVSALLVHPMGIRPSSRNAQPLSVDKQPHSSDVLPTSSSSGIAVSLADCSAAD